MFEIDNKEQIKKTGLVIDRLFVPHKDKGEWISVICFDLIKNTNEIFKCI